MLNTELVSFTLMCNEMTLINRAKERDNNLNPHFVVLEQAKGMSNTIKIKTANRSPEEVVDEMLTVIYGK